MTVEELKKSSPILVNRDVWQRIKNENSSVQYGLRPCVIMSNQKAINSSTVLNVLPITSKNKRCNKLHIPVSHECGLKLDSIVLAEQILTVSKKEIF